MADNEKVETPVENINTSETKNKTEGVLSKLSSLASAPKKAACFMYNMNVFILSFFKAFLAIVV